MPQDAWQVGAPAPLAPLTPALVRLTQHTMPPSPQSAADAQAAPASTEEYPSVLPVRMTHPPPAVVTASSNPAKALTGTRSAP